MGDPRHGAARPSIAADHTGWRQSLNNRRCSRPWRARPNGRRIIFVPLRNIEPLIIPVCAEAVAARIVAGYDACESCLHNSRHGSGNTELAWFARDESATALFLDGDLAIIDQRLSFP